jgi:hypothetical protein
LDRPSAGLTAAARYAVRAARTYCRDPRRFRRRLRQEFQERQNALVDECRLRLRLTLPGAFGRALEPESPADSTGVLLRSRVLEDIGNDLSDVALILDHSPVTIANSVAARVPSATVHLLTQRPLRRRKQARLRPSVSYQRCATIADRVDYLSKHRQPQLIVERGRNLSRAKVACFRELFPFVAPGGAYVVEALDSVPPEPEPTNGLAIADLLRWLDALHRGTPPNQSSVSTIDLADSAAGFEFCDDGNAVVARKAAAHQFKLRDNTANATLDARFDRRWGNVAASRPAFRWHSNAHLFLHGEGPIRETPVINVPERYLRCYESAQCWPMQRMRFSDYWLPDTFRHPLNVVLTHSHLANSSRYLARLPSGATVTEPTRSAHGPLFSFDSEYPGHFGHVMTDVVSRYWGWCAARERVPDVRPLISLGRGQESIPNFQRSIFASLGIDADTIEYIRPDECVEVDELYAATPDFVLPHYLNIDLAAVWDRIRRGCERAEAAPSSEKLFVSRRSYGLRTCTNGAEVEALFSRHGFHIIYPEDHDFADQVTMFHRAKILAGFGGSGMFTSMFAPEATIILISGDGYDASNEYMIKSVIGGNIHYFWGDSRIKHPPGKWTWAAYQSNFVFDVDRFEPEIARVVDSDCAG